MRYTIYYPIGGGRIGMDRAAPLPSWNRYSNKRQLGLAINILDYSKLWRCGTQWKRWEQLTDKQRQELDSAMPSFTRTAQ